MISELSPRLCPSQYHIIFLSSSHNATDIIVASVLMMSPSVTSTIARTNPVMRSKPHIHTNSAHSGTQDEGKSEPRLKRWSENHLQSSLSG